MWQKHYSRRAETLPRDWHRRRRIVLDRAKSKCEHVRYDTGKPCGAYANQCDHINDRLDHSLRNLQALCEYHHAKKSAEQGAAGLKAARAKHARKQADSHPGII